LADLRSQLKNSVREAAVVVGSILVAFALDAWWDDSVERRQTAEIVASLEAEFEANRETLRRDSATVEDYVQAAQRLLHAAAAPPADRPSLESMGSDLWKTLSWRTSNLKTAALDAAISAGRLESIEPVSLRIALAGWPAVIDDMAEEEEFEWREITERYHPLLSRFVEIPALETNDPLPTPSQESLARLLDSIEFRSRLAWRLDVSIVALRDKVNALKEVDRILGLFGGAS
jgi:hypothetical protein